MDSEQSREPAIARRRTGATLRRLGFGSALGVLAAVVLGSFVGVQMDGYEKAAFGDAFEGRAHRPFAYRALAPAVMRGGACAVAGVAPRRRRPLVR